MHTRDLDEIVNAVTRVYCPHTVRVVGGSPGIDAILDVYHPTLQPVVSLSYNAPVKIDAGNFSRLFLLMHCCGGAGLATQENETAEWRVGQTMPFSAGLDTQLSFDGAFLQRSVRLDLDKLHTLCARWLGHPLERPLRLSLGPFSKELERAWRRTLEYLWSAEEGSLPLPHAARAAFDEFLLTMLLHRHPHNYSGEIAGSVAVPVPSLIRRAERFMLDNAGTPITVSEIATQLGVSVRSLQTGFRQWRNTTPNAILRQMRLELVRKELQRGTLEASVTIVALRYGFSHLSRFSAYYRSAFGEAPSETLRRNRALSIGPNSRGGPPTPTLSNRNDLNPGIDRISRLIAR